jgi:hypothetical protein
MTLIAVNAVVSVMLDPGQTLDEMLGLCQDLVHGALQEVGLVDDEKVTATVLVLSGVSGDLPGQTPTSDTGSALPSDTPLNEPTPDLIAQALNTERSRTP